MNEVFELNYLFGKIKGVLKMIDNHIITGKEALDFIQKDVRKFEWMRKENK